MLDKKEFTTKLNGVEIKATFSNLAENANGSVLVEAGETAVFVTAVMSKNESTQNYFPLSVEFEEKFYSVGSILGSRFLRREGRPSQDAVLNGRIIDRTIRPLFPKGLHRDIQVIASVLSLGEYSPSALSVLGASLALGTSDIPWGGPVSAINYTQIEDEWKCFSTLKEGRDLPNNFLLCGKDDCITMIEMEGDEVSEKSAKEVGVKFMEDVKVLQSFQNDIIKKMGTKKIEHTEKVIGKELEKFFEENIKDKVRSCVLDKKGDLGEIESEWMDFVKEKEGDDFNSRVANSFFEDKLDKIIHSEAVENGKRADGRKVDELRFIGAKAGEISKRIHGTGIFYRGGTHVFTALTLGAPGDALLLNTIESPDVEQYFMHHYNFPPYSTGETGKAFGPKRREIGHGALAEKALKNVLPSREKFPYTIRLVSECFASNGSTSMGSVCASSIALMDGGVPIKAPVAGIAMGLMQKDGKHIVLTDIQGPEDHHGDMDFKIAGTKNGITAIQMDVKIDGITPDIFNEAIDKGLVAYMSILKTISEEIKNPRDLLSPFVPVIRGIKIDPEQIGLVIGGGGKTIKALRTDTGVASIDIEDDGSVVVSGDKEKVDDAIGRIEAMTKTFEVGEEFEGPVKSITEFGAFVEMSPEKDGLVHISEMSPGHVRDVNDILSVGDTVPVVVKELRGDGGVSLSIKDRDPEFFKAFLENQPKREETKRYGGGGDRRNGRGGDRGGDRRHSRGGDKRNNKKGGRFR